MGPTEAADYVAGMVRRPRQGWEQTRLLCDVVAKLMGAEDGCGIVFPWDEAAKPKTAEEKAAEAERIKAVQAWAKTFNNKNKSSNGTTSGKTDGACDLSAADDVTE